jgi:hypothetical protein
VDLQITDYAVAPGGKFITITLNGNDNLTNNMTKEGLQIDSGKVFQTIFKNKEVNCVAVFWQLPMVDTYGKKSDDIVMKIKLTRDTFSKINWDNFDFHNYPTIADFYFEHPALKKIEHF